MNQCEAVGGADLIGSDCRGDDRLAKSIGRPVAIYVHIPFCPSKCGYCDFNSFAMDGEIVPRTVAAIIREIERSPWNGWPAKTIFFGGGTPTFLPAESQASILAAVMRSHPPAQDCEITTEANPGTVDATKFRTLREAGFNRISLGAQSFQNEDLLRLGRVHGASEIGRAVAAARQAGFENLNLDLMFGLPNQSLRGWQNNLELAITLKPEHLSLYCLTIEPNTRFYKLHHRGMLDLPDEDAQVAMYDLACERANQSGFAQYEISNFSRMGRECRHNLCYWHGEEYLAYGPGAVGMARLHDAHGNHRRDDTGNHVRDAHGNHRRDADATVRYTNMKHPDRYCSAIETGAELWCDSEQLDESMLRTERIMMGIRLNAGLPLSQNAIDPSNVELLRQKGWADRDGEFLRLTAAGRHFCSEATLELI